MAAHLLADKFKHSTHHMEVNKIMKILLSNLELSLTEVTDVIYLTKLTNINEIELTKINCSNLASKVFDSFTSSLKDKILKLLLK